MLKTENISKLYQDKPVLEDLTLEIPQQKITSFIGSNGAGKSTLLSILSRLLHQSSGEVFLNEKNIRATDNTELARQISILKQANNIGIRITIEELVAFGRFPYSGGRLTPEDKLYVEKAIQYMELEDIRGKFIDELSGGQRQRAFIAMVLAQDTDYILLDEPLNNLDMKHSVQIMRTLRKMVNDLGKTVLLVIHDINFASCYSDYIAALKDGRMINFGTTAEIITRECLKEVFDMDFDIREINGNKICIYF